jgi:hypothetical protein
LQRYRSESVIMSGGDWMDGELMMLRKTMIALLAITAVSMLVPDVAAARGGHGGGGGGGGGGGWHGGGMAWHGSGMRVAAFGAGAGFAAGHFHHGFHRRVFFVGAGPYAYDDYYPYYYDDGYYAGDGGCYIVRQRVHTRYGWRLRPVQVCG